MGMQRTSEKTNELLQNEIIRMIVEEMPVQTPSSMAHQQH
jgi:hypothetical protein